MIGLGFNSPQSSLSASYCSEHEWQEFIKWERTDEEKMDRLCYCVRNQLSVNYADNDLASKNFVFYLISLSLLCDATSFFYISMFKGLQSHPMKIFMWLSFANFCTFWTMMLSSFICEINLQSLFSLSTGAVFGDNLEYLHMLT